MVMQRKRCVCTVDLTGQTFFLFSTPIGQPMYLLVIGASFFFFLPPSLGYEMKLLLIWDKSRGKRVKPIQQVGDLYLYFIEGVKETGNRSLTSWKLAASSTHKTLVSTSSTIHRKPDTKVQQVPPPCLAQRLYAGDLWRRGEWATGGGNGSALKTPTRRVGPLFLHRPECFFLC